MRRPDQWADDALPLVLAIPVVLFCLWIFLGLLSNAE